jgi:hypothetical protein
MQHRIMMTLFASIALATSLAACQPDNSQVNERLAWLEHELNRVQARGEIENVYNRYQYLHTAFQDEKIISDLWVKEGTPGVSAQYTNTGVYNTWESVVAYHRDRPSPTGKLLIHYNTSPLIEVAEDGSTAKGVWITAGVESGLAAPENAEKAPPAFFEDGLVNGKKVWAHWVFIRNSIDFLKQDGQWRIWHFRTVELARAPFNKDWISFASILENVPEAGQFHNDILYFGDDGKVVFYPEHDGPPKYKAYGYRTKESMELAPPLPEPYETFDETFEY